MDLRSYTCVCFDCDSTLSALEGIDELAKRLGLEDKIAPLTAAAMDGRASIEEVYALRLEAIRPDREALEWLGGRYIETMVLGAKDAVQLLQASGREVFIVSGGLKPPVAALGAALSIRPEWVLAVDVRLDANGGYAGFDTGSPLTCADGKARVTRELARTHGPVILVGDGMTDVAARAGGAFVIGFGGIAARPSVMAGANLFNHGPSLMDVARAILG